MPPSSKDGPRALEEARAFEEAMRGVRPLGGRAAVPSADAPEAPTAPARRQSRADPAFEVETTGESIAGRRRDVGADVVRRLRAGAEPIEARVDLHGRSVAEARRELERFVIGARSRRLRVVLVIHGRGLNSDPGGPVLRPAVWEWLQSPGAARAAVMAFVTARPRDGGAGATVLRLGK
jgi:DNA-nicking Smr family endonuclease